MKAKIYKYIVDYHLQYNKMPSLRQIAKGVGLKNPTNIARHINDLVELDILVKDEKGKVRFKNV